jgi:F-type H+-transporting ATPase subunit delta
VQGSGGMTAGLAGRYAGALFELAREKGELAQVGDSLARLAQALDESADMRAMTVSPLIPRAQGERAILALSDDLGLDRSTHNFLGVVARARRMGSLPAIIAAFRARAAAERGEATAQVTSAHPLSDEQVETLKQTLATKLRRSVDVQLRVDPAILGGLIVKVGSRLIDSSIKSKLAAVGAAMMKGSD